MRIIEVPASDSRIRVVGRGDPIPVNQWLVRVTKHRRHGLIYPPFPRYWPFQVPVSSLHLP